MFGGFGIYKNGIIFGIIAENELYFKVDEMLAEFFKKHGGEFFTYESNGKKFKMSYSKVPSEILENSELLKKWVELSFNVAVKAKIRKKTP
jgi:DNA transformation protein